MKDNISIIVYTHTDYSDVWPVFFGQTDKFLPEYKKYIFVNKQDERIPDDYEVLIYDDSNTYASRFSFCLRQVKTKYCILHHEDMFLYQPADNQRLLEYTDILENSDFEFVKLIKGGEERDIQYAGTHDLKQIPSGSEWIFSIQPSIWKTNRLLELYSRDSWSNIWEFETRAQHICRELNIKGLYSFQGERKRGLGHWDCKVYPYIATAIVKGKWNLSEYPEELGNLLKEYNIDPNIRGTR